MWEAIEWGLHQLAMSLEAIEHFMAEIAKKICTKQAPLVPWDLIKRNPPRELKISPITAILHKSKAFCPILDLLFLLHLKNGGVFAGVNDTTMKTAPAGAINRIGDCLSRVIHTFAEANKDAKIFMAKWDIKDGFWWVDCAKGEEWNFAYVLQQRGDQPVQIVVPTSLQMGWVESPPYFCAATETSCDVVTIYIETPVNSTPKHKFKKYDSTDPENEALLERSNLTIGFLYMAKVYLNNFMNLVIPVS